MENSERTPPVTGTGDSDPPNNVNSRITVLLRTFGCISAWNLGSLQNVPNAPPSTDRLALITFISTEANATKLLKEKVLICKSAFEICRKLQELLAKWNVPDIPRCPTANTLSTVPKASKWLAKFTTLALANSGSPPSTSQRPSASPTLLAASPREARNSVTAAHSAPLEDTSQGEGPAPAPSVAPPVRPQTFPRNTRPVAKPEHLPNPTAALTVGKLSPSYNSALAWAKRLSVLCSEVARADPAGKSSAANRLMSFAMSIYVPNRSAGSLTSAKKNKYSRAQLLASRGYVSSAVNTLVAPDVSLSNDDVDAKLAKLNEQPKPDLLGDFVAKDVPTQPLTTFAVSVKVVKQVLGKLPAASAPGPSGLSFLHLRLAFKLLRGEFARILRPLVQDIVDGLEWTAALSHSILIPIPKPDGNIRPIAIGEALRRLAGKCLAECVRRRLFDDEVFKDQFGIGEECGLERLFSAVRETYSKGGTVCAFDLSNAYGTVSRDYLTRVVDKYCPAMTAYVHRMYSSALLLSTTGSVLRSEEGIQQGDPTSPLLFSLCMKPVVDKLRVDFPGFRLLAYQDDMYALCDSPLGSSELGGRINRLFTAAETLFARVGMRLNRAKCAVCSKSAPTYDTNTSHLRIRRTKNLKVVGIPLGTPDFITEIFQKVANKMNVALTEVRKMVESVGDRATMSAIQLMSKSILQKCSHLLRNVSCSGRGADLCDIWHGVEKEGVLPVLHKALALSVIGTTLTCEDPRLTAPIKLGGLGLALPSYSWPQVYLGACRQLGTAEADAAASALIEDMRRSNDLPKGWPTTLQAFKEAIPPSKPQSKLVELRLQNTISSKLQADKAGMPHIQRALNVTPLTDTTDVPKGPAMRAILRNHLGIAPFEMEGLDYCPLCLLKSLSDEGDKVNLSKTARTIPASVDHALNCPCLRGGAKTTARHDPIVHTVGEVLRAEGVAVKLERSLKAADPLAKRPNEDHFARADIFMRTAGSVEPVVIDVTCSSWHSQAVRDKVSQYEPWNVEVIPAVVSLRGHCGQVKKDAENAVVVNNFWPKAVADAVGKPNIANVIAERVYARLYEGNVIVMRDYLKYSNAAINKLISAGYAGSI